jgi:hypothetical protein
MNALGKLKEHWRRRCERDHHFALDRTAGHMLGDYQRAIAEGASRQTLAEILTGLAGCELAMSRTNHVGWGTDRDEDGFTVGESCRWSGLLVQEIAYCAGDEPSDGLPEYRGVRAFEFQTEQIAEALTRLALSYRGRAANTAGNLGVPGEPPSVGQALDLLWHTVAAVIGGQAAEVLVPLMVAHGHDPYWEFYNDDADRTITFAAEIASNPTQQGDAGA